MSQIMTNLEKKRANITLLDDDVILINKLKDAIDKRLGIKVSLAFVVKLALREQARIEHIN